MIQAYAGSAIVLDDLNARVVLGQEIDVGTHAHAARGPEIGWTDAEPLFARHTCKLSVGEVDGPISKHSHAKRGFLAPSAGLSGDVDVDG